ncbi:MAG TPA: hypothetical protein VL486_09275 [Verrucomicrobiae bacterium]|nr:hypothetical protein [Verrucomicrobiae bacterium]
MNFAKQFIRIRRMAVVRHLIGLLVTFGITWGVFASAHLLRGKGPFASNLAYKILCVRMWYFDIAANIAEKLGGAHPEFAFGVAMAILMTTVNYLCFLALWWSVRFWIKVGRNLGDG